MASVRARLWVPNQFAGGAGAPERQPAILVGKNLVLVRHASFPTALRAPHPDLYHRDATTWTVEPLSKRPTLERELSTATFDFDQWGPEAAFLRFVRKSKKAPASWGLSLRSRMELPWAVVRAGEGDLASLLESAREMVHSEGFTMPPIVCEPDAASYCPPSDLVSIPQNEALDAVEGLISRTVNRA